MGITTHLTRWVKQSKIGGENMKNKIYQSTLPTTATLAEVKEELREHWKEGGISCPACTQLVKLWKEKLYSCMAYLLIRLYILDRKIPGFHHISEIYLQDHAGGSNNLSKLRFWELIESMPKVKGQKGRTSGYWQITEKGKAFVRGEIEVPAYTLMFNRKCYGFSEEKTDIKQALTTQFDYDELMKL